MPIEHKNITNENLHEPKDVNSAAANSTYVADGVGSGTWEEPEPKGVLAATADTIYVANGSQSGAFKDTSEIVRMGVWDYNDAATSSSAISLTPTGNDIILTNDGAGAFTNKTYKLSDVSELWDATTNRFDFTDLNLGDVVEIRIDLSVTTSTANTDTKLKINLAIGGSPYVLVIDHSSFKTAGTYQITKMFSIYMGDANTRDNPASLSLSSDSGSATVVVNGWYLKALKRGLV